MNREAIIKVRNRIKRLPKRLFDMNHWPIREHTCGTPACIGGWAGEVLLGDQGARTLSVYEAMGLEPQLGRALCFPQDTPQIYSATPRQAVRVLDHLLNTGVVDWAVAFSEDAG